MKIQFSLFAVLSLAGCVTDQSTIATTVANDAALVNTVTCTAATAAVIGVQVDSQIDTTKAAASTNTKIVNAATTLCAATSTAAKQLAAQAPATTGAK